MTEDINYNDLSATQQLLLKYSKNYACPQCGKRVGDGICEHIKARWLGVESLNWPINAEPSNFSKRTEKQSTKGSKIPERKLNMELALEEGEKIPNHKVNFRHKLLRERWAELFELCYGTHCDINKKNNKLLRKLCYHEDDDEVIWGSMVEFFLLCMTNKWHIERRAVASIYFFVRGYDHYRDKGIVARRYMNHPTYWWLINKLNRNNYNFPPNTLLLYPKRGIPYAWVVKDGEIHKQPIYLASSGTKRYFAHSSPGYSYRTGRAGG